MKKYTKNEIEKILENHKLWLDGKDGECACLDNANLRGADISGTNL